MNLNKDFNIFNKFYFLDLDLDNLFWLKLPHMMYILNLSLWSRIIKFEFQAITAIVKLWFTVIVSLSWKL